MVVYRPPSYSWNENWQLAQYILHFCIDKEVVIIGDFNLPKIDWLQSNPLAGSFDPLTQLFVDVFATVGLSQWTDSPTFVRSGNILDLVLTNSDDRVGDLGVLPPFPHCGHCPVVFDCVFQFDVQVGPAVSTRRAWWKGSYNEIDRVLQTVDWDFELAELSVSDMFERFLSLVNPLIYRFVPLCSVRSGSGIVNPPAWLKRARKHAWELYKQLRAVYGRHSYITTAALAEYDRLNSQFRNFHIHVQIEHESALIDRFRESSKFFHSYIRNKKVGCPSVGPLRLPDGCLTDDSAEMAELFADGFVSVYSDDHFHDSAPHQVFHGHLAHIEFSLEEVSRRLSELDVDSAMGPDGLHPRLLKCCPAVIRPLYMIFRRSLSTGKLPYQWKDSLVVPLFKKGSRYSPLNYRPISLTSVCCKTLERIIVDRLYEYLESNGVLSSDQYGFRRGRTVDDQLLLTYDRVSHWYDLGYVVDVILFDFLKAFDVVPHSVLIAKLRLIGVGGALLQWISDFLRGRQMRVSVSGTSSESRQVKSGVPQGSVLGPLLFLLFVNFLPAYIISECKFFADDLKIYLKVRRSNPTEMALDLSACQRDIDVIVDVARSWGLELNAGKCSVLRFQRGGVRWSEVGSLAGYSLDGVDIQFATSSRDLGVIVDSDLKFHIHVRSIVAKAAGLSCNILNSTMCRSREFMMTLYLTHIRPLLEFGSCVWNLGYVSDLKLLEGVQRRWTKRIDGLEDLSYGDRLAALDLYSVGGRLLRADIIKYWKIFHGKSGIIPSDLFTMAPAVGTRGHRFKVAHVRCHVECRKRFFALRCVDLWNSLPDQVVALDTVESFKRGIHGCLGELLYEFVD